MRGLAATGAEDGVADTTRILDHGMVPDSQHAIAEAFQVDRATLVIGDLLRVLAAIEFEDELGFGAQEIDDVGAARDLALPFPTAELAVADRFPDASFDLCVGATQFSRPFSAPRFIDAPLT